MTQQTARGITYPESTDHTRIWEHIAEVAQDVDTILTIDRVQVEDTTSRTTASNTYTNASGGAFSATVTVPRSGCVDVSMRVTQRNSSTSNTITSWNATGSTSGALYANNDNAAAIQGAASNLTFTIAYLFEGLVPGETVTVTMVHRVNNVATTGTFDYRQIILKGQP
ncbi:MAG TPA: hypothetical protein VIQ11_09600 [Mycobacterium sp.]